MIQNNFFTVICALVLLCMGLANHSFAESWHSLDGLTAERTGRSFCRYMMGNAFEYARRYSFESLHPKINEHEKEFMSRWQQKSHLEQLVLKREISAEYILPLVGLDEQDLSLQELRRSSIFTVAIWSVALGDRPVWKTPNGIPFTCAAAMRLTCPEPGELRKAINWLSTLPIIRVFFSSHESPCEWRVVAYKTLNKSKYIDQITTELNGPGLPVGSVLDEQAIDMYALAAAAAADKPVVDKYRSRVVEEERKAQKDLEQLHTAFLEEQLGLDQK